MTEPTARPGPERRRFRRVPLHAPVIVISLGEVRTYAARDVCPGGIFLRAREAPPVGAQVRVELVLSQSRRFLLTGKVIRDDTARPAEPGFAVAFEESIELQAEILSALRDAGRVDSPGGG